MRKTLYISLAAALGLANSAPAQRAPTTGVRPARLIIRNATVVDGNGTPAKGPFDIVVENGTIAQMIALDPVAAGRNAGGRRARSDANTAEIDATGKYVLPGLINAHAHLQDERGGTPQPIEYELKIWLASGITAVRDVGSSTQKALAWRDASNKGTLAAPRIFIYPQFGRPTNADSARARVRSLKAQGVDGIKLLGIDRDIMQAMEDEAHKEGLRIAHHVGVEETNAWDDIRFGTTSIEHWYGIPDAAILDGVQGFPSSYNYNNETDRFRWAGRLWREADPARLGMVLDSMVARKVAWVPTLDIYEASRDLQRAKTQPWFGDYLHPTLEEYFRPDPANHGSYFFGWSSTDETYWKENYRI
ncbi:MAG TPA: amidohydrolase, partial [Gemmatimonadaceae bacterium]